jgi:hypothetical protein
MADAADCPPCTLPPSNMCAVVVVLVGEPPAGTLPSASAKPVALAAAAAASMLTVAGCAVAETVVAEGFGGGSGLTLSEMDSPSGEMVRAAATSRGAARI